MVKMALKKEMEISKKNEKAILKYLNNHEFKTETRIEKILKNCFLSCSGSNPKATLNIQKKLSKYLVLTIQSIEIQ
jgi:hypothetical protein